MANLQSAIEPQGNNCRITVDIAKPGCYKLDFLWGEMDYNIVGGYPGNPRQFFVTVPELGLIDGPVNLLQQTGNYYSYYPDGWSLIGKLTDRLTIGLKKDKDKPIISGIRLRELDPDTCDPLSPQPWPIDYDFGTDEFLPGGVCVDCT
jgi:hypothetical protein